MKDNLKNIFQNSYPGIDVFISDVLTPIFSEDFIEEKNVNLIVSDEIKKRANNANILKACHVADIDRIDSDPIAVYDVTLKPNSKITHSRVAIKQFITALSMTYTHVFIVFHYENESERPWRFSYVYKESTIAGTRGTAKRYTYVFGKDYHCRTAIDRFIELANSPKTDVDFANAFSVEALSKEFFNGYKAQYEKFVGTLSDTKQHRDYVKKLLGRLVFLQFLQKKGWMGVPASNAKWEGGDKNYLSKLVDTYPNNNRLLSDVLEPLFFKTLNEKRNGDIADSKLGENIKIPYLNGGLFDKDKIDELDIDFPYSYFKELMNFFSQYNFTIDENDPNDAEVGVDPEMLGKIFENLLEDNKDKGAFYTPKEIVRYMCQESLIAYLETNTSVAKDKIRQFVLSPEEGVVDIPENKKPKLLAALEEVKICDPAIGSGAFPMGLLNELLHCREVLSGEHYDRAEIKKSIIQNNIYGVDIEKGAVDIARLRFWLSIVVDEETPSPLPNLDYKIMQGNSLIESYKGIDLSKLTEKINAKRDTLFEKSVQLSAFEDNIKELQQSVSRLLAKYYSCFDHEEKKALRQRISVVINEQLEVLSYDFNKLIELKTINLAENNKFFLWHTWFSDVFNREDKEGFDIVIGNPPYIQLQNNGGELAKLYEDCHFQTFAKTGDIYCLFYEKGWQLLRQQGHLCFITSNKWMRAGYGEKTRGFFAQHTNPKYLIDFAGVKIFDNATVDTNILIFGKGQNEYQTRCAVTDKLNKDSLKNLSDFVQQQSVECRFDSSDSWVILSPIEQSIKRKIESVGTPLKDWDIQINYGIKTGFNDAFIINTEKRNEILDNCSSEEERTKTAELIRPILRGRDIKRYGYNWADLWLIATFPSRHYDIEMYPAVKAHLLSFGKERLEQTGKKYIINGEEVKARKKTSNKWFETQDSISYWDDFNQPKIVFQEIVQESQFLLDANENFFCNDTGRIIVGKHLYHLLGILNSELFFFSVKHFYGGGVLGEHGIRMKHTFFENFPCLAFDERIESIAKKLQQFYSNTLNQNLNDYIMTLYQLTDEEKLYVKGKLIQFPQNQ